MTDLHQHPPMTLGRAARPTRMDPAGRRHVVRAARARCRVRRAPVGQADLRRRHRRAHALARVTSRGVCRSSARPRSSSWSRLIAALLALASLPAPGAGHRRDRRRAPLIEFGAQGARRSRSSDRRTASSAAPDRRFRAVTRSRPRRVGDCCRSSPRCYTRRRAVWWSIAIGVWVIAVLVAASRVVLGVHWPIGRRRQPAARRHRGRRRGAIRRGHAFVRPARQQRSGRGWTRRSIAARCDFRESNDVELDAGRSPSLRGSRGTAGDWSRPSTASAPRGSGRRLGARSGRRCRSSLRGGRSSSCACTISSSV